MSSFFAPEDRLEAKFLTTAEMYWSGGEWLAIKRWAEIAKDYPDTPWGQKAAAEADKGQREELLVAARSLDSDRQ